MVFVGDAGLLRDAGVPTAPWGTATEDAFPHVHVPLAEPAMAGKAQPANAKATITAIETAVSLTRSGKASGIVTNPITKKILVEGAGFGHPGHTEFLAALDGRDRSVMMLACPDLRVVPVTIHIPIEEVPTALTADLLEETINITAAALRNRFGIDAPRIAVAGLNPHAGEGGLMGDDEQRVITPLLDRLRRDGMQITGPLPADTMFHATARARYDVAVCMYHDQALIPVKTLGFDTGVNITLGLSFVRTSPDHGTAYDIAGKGIADAQSLIAAIRMADQMANQQVHP